MVHLHYAINSYGNGEKNNIILSSKIFGMVMFFDLFGLERARMMRQREEINFANSAI